LIVLVKKSKGLTGAKINYS